MQAKLIHKFAIVFLLLMMPVDAIHADDNFLQNKEYKICMRMTRTKPQQAYEHALGWEDRGGSVAARHCMAVALFQLELFSESALRLEELANQMPDDTPQGMVADILGHAGVAWMSAGENSKAYAAQSAALELSPMNPYIHTDRAMVLFDAGKNQEAIDDLSVALDVLPNQPDILVFRASAYRQSDAFSLALKDLNIALQLDPENPEGLLERGIIFRLTGKNDEARQDWLKLIEYHDGKSAAESAKRNLELLDIKNNE